MCQNNKWITNPYTNKSVYVKCGKCPACQQEKAAFRANRIRNEYASGNLCLFVTLTYENKFVPYFTIQDYKSADKFIKIHRDCEGRYNRSSSNYDVSFQVTDGSHQDVYLPDLDSEVLLDSNISNFRPLKHYNDRFGVCLFKDVQDYLKRLRQNLIRNEKIEPKFSYFACTEYGGKSHRPHAHLLLFIPYDQEMAYRRAHNKSWPFENKRVLARNIEVARDPAGYVASYVNSNNSLSPIFESRKFKQKHSYSRHFGGCLQAFSLDNLLRCSDEHNFTYTITKKVDGVPTQVTLPIPQYALRWYFPKFYGYSRLTDCQIFDIIAHPYAQWKNPLGQCLSVNDKHVIPVKLSNAFKRYHDITGKSIYDYAIDHIRVWRSYLHFQYKNLLLSQSQDINWCDFYDNIAIYRGHDTPIYRENLRSLSLDDWIRSNGLHNLLNVSDDANLHSHNVERTARLSYYYEKYSKQKYVTNTIESEGLDLNV